MKFRVLTLLTAVLCALLVAQSMLSADTLKLKDGTKVEGRVIPQGADYWVKLPDGSSRTISRDAVTEWIKGDGTASAGPATPATPATPAKPTGLNFAQTKIKADRSEVPLAAVAAWQSFIEANATSPDLAAAQKELAFWQKRVDDNAEKINGKWVGGEERKAIHDKVDQLARDADRLMASNQTLQAVSKFEEIIKIYPNHFPTNFWLGFLNLRQEKFDRAQQNLENALRVNPESAEALTNYAIVLNRRKEYEKSMKAALRAAEIRESKAIVQNLVNACDLVPPAMKEHNKNVQPAMQAATLLASKYGIKGPGDWTYIGLRPAGASMSGDKKEVDPSELPTGVIGMGSGMIVSADGLILTNRHVASVGDVLMVRLSDGTRKPAERVVIDDEQDLALIRIKPDKPLPFVTIANEPPGPGAECTALGYPMGDVFGITLQVSPGTVSSIIREKHADIVVNCKVNPGNSGGPLVDRYGNVAGVVTFKTKSDEMTDSYGLAIGAARVREFLKKTADKHHVTLPAAPAEGTAMNTEAVYKKVSPAAVCIIMIRSGDKAEAKAP